MRINKVKINSYGKIKDKEINLEKGINTSLEQIVEEIQKRDYSDIHKEFGALKKAEDAIEVDTTYMSVEEVVNYIISKVKELVK